MNSCCQIFCTERGYDLYDLEQEAERKILSDKSTESVVSKENVPSYRCALVSELWTGEEKTQKENCDLLGSFQSYISRRRKNYGAPEKRMVKYSEKVVE